MEWGLGMRKTLAALACLGLLAACSPANDLPQGEAGITTFHQKLNAQDYNGIYDGASPDFRATTSRADFQRFMAAIHRKLGAFQSGSSAGWNDSMLTSGHMLTINYAAKYDQGSAEESFVYRLADGKAVLAGYHVNSTALVIN